MKAVLIIVFLVICITSSTSCSQKKNNTECDTTCAVDILDPYNLHFQFLGIPINGTPEEFGKALESKDFYYQNSYNGHHGEYWGKFFDSYAYVKLGYETRNNTVYEVEVTFENYSKAERQNLLEQIVEKYSQMDAEIMMDDDEDFEIIIWTSDSKTDHDEFDKGRISSREVKGVIVFENNGKNLILRYIDVINKNLHLMKENEDL